MLTATHTNQHRLRPIIDKQGLQKPPEKKNCLKSSIFQINQNNFFCSFHFHFTGSIKKSYACLFYAVLSFFKRRRIQFKKRAKVLHTKYKIRIKFNHQAPTMMWNFFSIRSVFNFCNPRNLWKNHRILVFKAVYASNSISVYLKTT